mgnify:CR=1 FL=1|tara:strand:+ start:126 stop:533 length:408 start_codon:yes stop_codon:yes gene_type:complete
MADAVSTTVVQDGSRFYVAQFTNTSDGSGESAVTKIDVSALAANNKGEVCTGVRINKIWWRTVGMSVRVLYDATSDVAAWDCKIDDTGYISFESFDGLPNYAGSGKTGDIQFTTTGHSSGDIYVIVIECIKEFKN